MAKKRRYSREEKMAIVALAVTEGISGLADKYGVYEKTLHKWVQQYQGELAAGLPGRGDEVLDEREKLKRRISELEAENAFLKKISAHFTEGER